MSQKIIYNISDLVFGVTEDCCLRCAYCVYSGKYYIGERNHNETRMTIEVARKAMDLFFNYINRSSRTFKKKVILQEKFEFIIPITTNGLLLKDEIVDFLVDKNFTITVSIDGPQEMHDKFRLKVDGKGSWQTIMKNLRRLKHRYPEYYQKKVYFMCTVHPLYNGEELKLFCPKNHIIADLTDYLQFKEDAYEKKKTGISVNNVTDYLEFLQ
jgi:uncharacterized protein